MLGLKLNHVSKKGHWSYHSIMHIPQEGLSINTLRQRQNGRHFADDTFKRIFLKEHVRILIKISLKFVPKSPIDNIPTLFQIMAWRQPGDKPLSEAMMVSLLIHIYVARPQWVNSLRLNDASVNWVIIDSVNGLSPVRRQAITWTNADLLSLRTLGTNFNEFWI